ncbi:hypothetical protein, partial [Staphylococcus chromogenes]
MAVHILIAVSESFVFIAAIVCDVDNLATAYLYPSAIALEVVTIPFHIFCVPDHNFVAPFANFVAIVKLRIPNINGPSTV